MIAKKRKVDFFTSFFGNLKNGTRLGPDQSIHLPANQSVFLYMLIHHNEAYSGSGTCWPVNTAWLAFEMKLMAQKNSPTRQKSIRMKERCMSLTKRTGSPVKCQHLMAVIRE